MRKIVIIGAGQAGAVAALKLRELGFGGAITLIGDEAYPPYERPELSKSYALGKISFSALVVLTPEVAAEKDIALALGSQVTGIDRSRQIVRTAHGDHSYDTLILATGGTARRLSLPRALRRKTYAIRTRDDADALHDKLPLSRSVVVVGGGWLGTEVAITARGLCPDVHLVEIAPRLCNRVAPRWLSERLLECQNEAGVSLHLGEVPTFEENGAVIVDGDPITPDLVIEAIGMQANDALARDAGLACDDGILVGPNGETEDPTIFAIGDCARQEQGRRESWQHANQSAEDVARILTGTAKRKDEPDWFWTTQGSHKIQMVGECNDAAEQWERRGPRGVSRLFLKGTRLIGCIAIDYPRDIAEARRLIAEKRSLDQSKAANMENPLAKCVVDARETVRLPH